MKLVYSRISSKGQFVIPAPIREELGIHPGTQIAVRVEGSSIILEPQTIDAKIRQIRKMRGITKGGPSMTDSLLEERRKERERELAEKSW